MNKGHEEQTFQLPLPYRIGILVVGIIFASACGLLFMYKAGMQITIFMGTFAFLCFIGFVESTLTKVILTRDAIVMTKGTRRWSVAHQDIIKVTWEKGCPVTVQTKNEKWVKIPEIIGYNSQSMTNSIRAWLKKGSSL